MKKLTQFIPTLILFTALSANALEMPRVLHEDGGLGNGSTSNGGVNGSASSGANGNGSNDGGANGSIGATSGGR